MKQVIIVVSLLSGDSFRTLSDDDASVMIEV